MAGSNPTCYGNGWKQMGSECWWTRAVRRWTATCAAAAVSIWAVPGCPHTARWEPDGCAAVWWMCCHVTDAAPLLCTYCKSESRVKWWACAGVGAQVVSALVLLLASRRWEWSISAFPSSALPLTQLWISSGNRLCSVAGTQDLSSQFFFPSQNRFQICIKFLFILPPLLYVFAAEGKAESVQDRHWRSYHSSYEPSPAMVPNEPL